MQFLYCLTLVQRFLKLEKEAVDLGMERVYALEHKESGEMKIPSALVV